MPLVPVNVDVPTEIYAGLLTGKYTRVGSVVRESGKIVKHLDEAFISEQGCAFGELRIASALKDIANRNNVLIGIGVVAVIAGTIAYYTVKSSKKKKSTEIQIPKCAADFNSTLCNYLDAIQSGNLDTDIINRLISDLDEVKGNYTGGNIKIDFSAYRLTTLMNLIFDYTKKFANANSVELNELEAPATESGIFANLRHYLEVQKQIFEKVA
jgi:hypothetical protein